MRSESFPRGAWVALLGLSLTGCGSVEDAAMTPAEPGVLEQEVTIGNGLSLNGLSVNGLSVNGLSLNGISVNGLSSGTFTSWFQADAALNDVVMSYVVRCAVPAGQTRTYRDLPSGNTYTWAGALGLAPAWASGLPATEADQQLVSACLAAHVNKYGAQVPLSVLGRNAWGQGVPYSNEELQAYPKREACFFGNLFQGQGVFVGSEGHLLGDNQSSLRACSLASSSGGARTRCDPLQYIGQCSAHCTLDASWLYYTSCTYRGRTWRPLTTRLRDRDIYACGDGTCQPTESCGMSTRYDSCRADCGPCP